MVQVWLFEVVASWEFIKVNSESEEKVFYQWRISEGHRRKSFKLLARSLQSLTSCEKDAISALAALHYAWARLISAKHGSKKKKLVYYLCNTNVFHLMDWWT